MTHDDEYLPHDQTPIGTTVTVGSKHLPTLGLWRVQVTPLLMHMTQETRVDGVERGIVILHPKRNIKITVSVFDAKDDGASVLKSVALGGA
jgi:hypothetical protein